MRSFCYQFITTTRSWLSLKMIGILNKISENIFTRCLFQKFEKSPQSFCQDRRFSTRKILSFLTVPSITFEKCPMTLKLCSRFPDSRFKALCLLKAKFWPSRIHNCTEHLMKLCQIHATAFSRQGTIAVNFFWRSLFLE